MEGTSHLKKNELLPLVNKVSQLNYIGKDLSYIPDSPVSSDFVNIKELNLSHNQIQSLRGLEKFTTLEKLDLDNNDICDSTLFPSIISLQSLTLNNNNLMSLKALVKKITKAFPGLVYLSLLGNKACPMEFTNPECTAYDYQQYRCYIACHLHQLRFLDWKPVTTAERFKGCELFNESMPNSSSKSIYTPLPKTSTISECSGKVLAGTLKYKYIGKKSEGNRFIRNNDL